MALNLKTQHVKGGGLHVYSTLLLGFDYLLKPGEDPSEAMLPALGEFMEEHGYGFPQRSRDRLNRALERKQNAYEAGAYTGRV